MARTLDVYLHQHKVGRLIQDDHGQMLFRYDADWLASPDAVALSHSLPLREETFERHECRGFFGGILPEEGKREMVAKNLGISARNDFAMLEQIGGECAGAVTFLPEGEALPAQQHNYRPLSDEKLAEILELLPRRPLMAGEDGIRLSLAGAQDKLAVHVAGDTISIPLGGAPSTHILKPAIERFEGTVYNEAFCMKLAAACGLPTAKVETRSVGDIDYLLVERYDRKVITLPNLSTTVSRLHQEDFCQALGIPSDMKYQSEGGVTLAQAFALLRGISSMPVRDLQHLLDAVLFNLLIGNHDAHGKNFSLVYDYHSTLLVGDYIKLAPLYDVLCTAYYPELSAKMAMKLGGEYKADKLYPYHFEKLADAAGLGKALVKKRVLELAETVLQTLETINIPHASITALPEFIRQRCQKMQQRFKG